MALHVLLTSGKIFGYITHLCQNVENSLHHILPALTCSPAQSSIVRDALHPTHALLDSLEALAGEGRPRVFPLNHGTPQFQNAPEVEETSSLPIAESRAVEGLTVAPTMASQEMRRALRRPGNPGRDDALAELLAKGKSQSFPKRNATPERTRASGNLESFDRGTRGRGSLAPPWRLGKCGAPRRPRNPGRDDACGTAGQEKLQHACSKSR